MTHEIRMMPRVTSRSQGLTLWGCLLGLTSVLACHDFTALTGTQELPAGTPNPSSFNTSAGALASYQAALAAFQYTNGANSVFGGNISTDTSRGAFVDYVLYSGLWTDELHAGDLGCVGIICDLSVSDLTDARKVFQETVGNVVGGNSSDRVYSALQSVRGGAAQASGALTAYDSTAPTALRGHLHALAGYAELLLADFFCSGVPLSTLQFGGDFTYARGDSTQAVYRSAVAEFDTALMLVADSARFLNLARVGKGRAWLAVGAYDSAAAAVALVPDPFAYQFLVDWSGGFPAGQNLFTGGSVNATVSDREGHTGLPYLTDGASGDPRTASDSTGVNAFGIPQYVPKKYGGAAPSVFPITVADGIEARLIQAEAALHARQYGTWLAMLNRARALAAPSLPALSDPGASPKDSARVLLLFRERAYDLFLTGHRQGDLRRLIRQYGFTVTQLYPTGVYPSLKIGQYSTGIVATIPSAESANPLFHGCLSQGA